MIQNDVKLTQIFAWIFFSAKSSLFNQFLTLGAAFLKKSTNWKSKMPFLRHLTTFYDLLRHLDLTQSRHVFFNYTISVFQTQYSIFCCFFFSSQMNFSLNERGTTEKRSKMLFLRHIYDLKWYCMMTSWPDYLHKHVLAPFHCDKVNFWQVE